MFSESMENVVSGVVLKVLLTKPAPFGKCLVAVEFFYKKKYKATREMLR